MAKSLVTIGLPFRNPGEHFILCIQSILAQTFDDWKLIAIDDGSTDSSLKTIRAVRDSRIQVLSDGESRGLADRLNQITELADTEFLARMDADDIMHPDRLATQCIFLERHPEKSLAISSAYIIDEATDVIGIRRQDQPDLRLASVLRRAPFIHPTITARRTWFVQNPYRPDYTRAEDHELWCRTCTRRTDFGILTRPFLFYRDREQAVSKYSMSCRTDRKIFRDYGPEHIGTAATLGLIAISHAKEIVYEISSRLGLERTWLAARNATISGLELQEATDVLAFVKRTKLPATV